MKLKFHRFLFILLFPLLEALLLSRNAQSMKYAFSVSRIEQLRPNYTNKIMPISAISYTLPNVSLRRFTIRGFNVPHNITFPKSKDMWNYTNTTQIRLLEYQSVVVASTCGYGTLENIDFQNFLCQFFYNNLHLPNPKNLIGEFETVIAVCHSSTPTYGHFIVDTFQTLIQFPRNLLESSHIVVWQYQRFMSDFLSLIGISSDQLLVIPQTCYAFADRLYMIDPLPCTQKVGYLTQSLRSFISKSIPLDKSPPKRFSVLKRESIARNLANYNEVFGNLTKTYSNYPWEWVPDLKSLAETAKYMNEVRLLFTTHGSGEANCVFMQPGTVLSEYQTCRIADFYFLYCTSIGVSIFFYRDPSMIHFSTLRTVANVSGILHMVGRAIEFLSS